MFNQEGKIIGNIIEISYDETIYDNSNYNYNTIVNEVYDAINNNVGYFNRCFYIYLSDDIEKQYNSIDMHEFENFLVYGLRL